jgi:hypothetical protein
MSLKVNSLTEQSHSDKYIDLINSDDSMSISSEKEKKLQIDDEKLDQNIPSIDDTGDDKEEFKKNRQISQIFISKSNLTNFNHLETQVLGVIIENKYLSEYFPQEKVDNSPYLSNIIMGLKRDLIKFSAKSFSSIDNQVQKKQYL